MVAANWGPLSETVISGMPWQHKNDFLKVVDGVFSRRTFKGSYFEESRIIVRNNDVRFTTVVEQVGGYFLPWSFWQRS